MPKPSWAQRENDGSSVSFTISKCLQPLTRNHPLGSTAGTKSCFRTAGSTPSIVSHRNSFIYEPLFLPSTQIRYRILLERIKHFSTNLLTQAWKATGQPFNSQATTVRVFILPFPEEPQKRNISKVLKLQELQFSLGQEHPLVVNICIVA